jgi:type I restriction enzyme, S subunit
MTAAPKGWAWTELSTIAQLESGHTPSRQHPEYWDGGVPWIGIRDATQNHGRTLTSTLQSISDEGLKNSSARLLPENTVCLSRTASVGYVLKMGRRMATSQDFVNWVCGPKLLPDYLKYVLLAEGEHLLRFASGTTHQTIYYPEAKAFHVLLPPPVEQRSIVGVLGALDDKIELNRKMNETLEQMAQAIFKSWFIDFDGHSEFHDSPLGPIPKGWISSQLGEHAGFLSGFPFKSELFSSEPRGPRLMKGSNIAPGEPAWDDAVYWPHPITERVLECTLGMGDVVLAMDRPWIPAGLKLFMLSNADIPSLLVQRVARLRGTPRYPTSLLYSSLRRREFTAHLLAVQTGTTVPHISKNGILSFPIVVPPLDIAEAYEGAAMPLYNRALANRAQITSLAELRDTLLPKLISGEIRIKHVEKTVGEAT